MDREALVQESLPLVQRVARSFLPRLPRHVELSDLIQAGMVGLLDASAKFDFDKGVRFWTYAELRIRGAILDSLRGLDWVPRSLRRERRAVSFTETTLQSRLGRKPSEGELASAMNVPLAELRRTRHRIHLAERASESASCVDPVEPLVADPEALDPEVLLERRELEDLLARGIEGLSERERLVLTLYYRDELTMKEVGRILGVNESRVSQIHSKTIGKLRLRLRAALRPALARTA